MILRCDRQVAMLTIWDGQALVGQALTHHAAAHSAQTVIFSSLFTKGPCTYPLSDGCPMCSREVTSLLRGCILGLLMCHVAAVPCNMQAASADETPTAFKGIAAEQSGALQGAWVSEDGSEAAWVKMKTSGSAPDHLFHHTACTFNGECGVVPHVAPRLLHTHLRAKTCVQRTPCQHVTF